MGERERARERERTLGVLTRRSRAATSTASSLVAPDLRSLLDYTTISHNSKLCSNKLHSMMHDETWDG